MMVHLCFTVFDVKRGLGQCNALAAAKGYLGGTLDGLGLWVFEI